jgi:hypothetical protein
MVEGHTFKAVLGTDSIRSIQSNLVLNVDETGGGITKDHGPAEFIRIGFTTGSVEEASLNSRVEVVSENTVTWDEHVGFVVAYSVCILGSGSGVIRGAGLFSILAGSALGVASASASIQTKGKLVQETAYSQPLDMGKGKVPKLVVPAEPNLLEWVQIAVGGVQD